MSASTAQAINRLIARLKFLSFQRRAALIRKVWGAVK